MPRRDQNRPHTSDAARLPGVLSTFRRHRSAIAAFSILNLLAPLVLPTAALAQDRARGSEAPPENVPSAPAHLEQASDARELRDAPSKAPSATTLSAKDKPSRDGVDARAAGDALTKAVDKSAGGVTVPDGASVGSDSVETKEAVAPGGAADKTGASSQAISMPKGAGTLQGMGESFSAQLSTGISTFSVPFALPGARGGAQPSLGLSYSSGSGWGVAGMGWDVGAPFIARQTDRGVPHYDDRADYWPGQDRFIFNGGQELVPICTVRGTDAARTCDGALPNEAMPPWSLGSQYFRPRVEGSFLRFFWSVDHQTWRVQDKSGVTMELGVPLDGSGDRTAILVNRENPTQIARWALARQYDTQGGANPLSAAINPTPNNVVIYRYHPDEPSLLLTDIYDTSPAAAPTTGDLSKFAHHAHLEYQERTDPTVSYHLGFKLERRLRLARVDVTSMTFNYGTDRLRQQLRRYHLAYDGSLSTSLLASVQVEGRCGGRDETETEAPSEGPDGRLRASNCPRLPAMTFDYTHVAPFLSSGVATFSALSGFEGFDERTRDIDSSPTRSVDEDDADFFDLNGDALPDFLVTLPGVYGSGFGQFLNSPAGSANSFAAVSNLPMLGAANAGALRLSNANVSILDLDGDAQVDLLYAPLAKTYSVFPLRSTGLLGRDVKTASQNDLKLNFGKDAALTRVLDVNGDGLVDVVVTTGTELQTFFALGRTAGGSDQFGHVEGGVSISNDPVKACLPFAANAVSFGDPEIKLGDLNGDGLQDIVKLQNGKVRYWPGRGNGVWGTGNLSDCLAGGFASKTDVAMTDSPSLIDGQGLRIDDVNGDGLDDLLEVRANEVHVWLNINGVGWTPQHTIKGTPPAPDFHDRVRLLDINGSGTRDLVWGDAGHFKYIDLQGGQRPWLLNRVANGLGKTTNIEYSTSTEEMRAAERQGGDCSSTDWSRPWCKKMPIVTHVVHRVTESDNLAFAGFAANNIVTEYEYRDPVYDGRQREFRGFQRARSKLLGDATSPTSYSESQFLLGECVEEAPNVETCTDPSADNRREALKGLPVVTEQYDTTGVYHSTAATAYRLRKLYAGSDGRQIRHAYAVATRTTLYDTDAGPAAGAPPIAFNAVELETSVDSVFDPVTTPKGVPNGLSLEALSVPLRASTGTGTIETRSQVDYFGNTVVGVSLGCTTGTACPGAATTGLDPNQAIYSFTIPGRPTGDATGWLHRTVSSYVSGDYRTLVTKSTITTYDTRGNPLTVKEDLQGTQPLLRSHRTLTGSTVVAPAPTAASSNGLKTLVTNTYDGTFGNVTQIAGANGRCRKFVYDGVAKGYQQLVTAEQIYTAPGCTGASLTTGAAYDRGYGQPTVVTDAAVLPNYATYDEFGRLVSVTSPLPNGTTPNQSTLQPSTIFKYTLPAFDRPFSTIETSTHDSADVATAHYRWNVAFVDGMGRVRLTRSQADKTNGGDARDAIDGGFTTVNAKGAVARKYLAQFTDAGKTDPLPSTFGGRFGRIEYDAFGRTLRSFDLAPDNSGVQTVRYDYHALSKDIWDAADLGQDAGQAHQATPATEQQDGHGRTIVTTERVKVGSTNDLREVRMMYQTGGELIAITRVHPSSADPAVVRWMAYDTFGRMVMNVDPHTTQNFSATLTTNPTLTGMRPWLYAYNDAGDLVGTSDARGCGTNYTYDAAGRLTSEDYSPCEAAHAPYSAPNFTTHAGVEVFYQYDAVPTSFSDVIGVPVGSPGNGLPATYAPGSPFLAGRLAAVYDRSGLQMFSYDGRGRSTRLDRRLADPDPTVVDPRLRYRGRWYATTSGYDAENRVVLQSTGATTAELTVGTKSELAVEYSARGIARRIAGSYGELVTSVKRNADGLLEEVVYGDVAHTTATQTYDARNWLATSLVSRSIPSLWQSPPANYLPPPTPNGAPSSFQMVLRQESFGYDIVGNPKSITDFRLPSEWPAGAKPVSRVVGYDDLYRVTSVGYAYNNGSASTDDTFVSPFAPELAGSSDPRQSSNIPTHLIHPKRIKSQTLEYDWLGNLSGADDDTHTMWDRSVGPVTSNSAGGKPYQWKKAGKLANSSWAGNGTAEALAYDETGNLLDLQTTKVGTCSNGATSCTVRFTYAYDEVGRLNRGLRIEGGLTVADLGFTYDQDDSRVVKADRSAATKTYSAYLFRTLELRRATYNTSTGDFLSDGTTETPILVVAGESLGRVSYENNGDGEPRIGGNRQHVLLSVGDDLGSASVVVDRSTGELVERRTHLPYGATESDHRPARWKGFREDYGFTGKEEDVEVGLQYFGKRYLSPYLGRWISPDPLAIHAPGSADLNLFAYVRGGVLRAIDPLGLEPSSVTTMSDFGIPPPRDDNGVPLNAPPVKVIVKLESYVSAADSVRHAASRKANLDLAEKQGNAHGLLGFAGMNSALRPLSPNTTLPPGLQQLAQGTFSEGVQKGSNFNANVTDIAVRVATTPLILAPSAPMTAHIAGATAVWGALGGGAVALGLTAATSTSTGFDYARNLHAAFTGAYVGGILTANAGSIGGEALQLQLRPTFAQLGVRAGSQIAGGVVGYGTETALNGGEFSGLGAVVAGGTSLLGGEVSRGLGGQGFWGDLGSAALGSAASKVADGLTSPQASFTNAQEMHGNF